MVKPQFEVGKDRVGAGGVVRDPRAARGRGARRRAPRPPNCGGSTVGVTASPLPGPSGNVEYFLRLRAETDSPLEGERASEQAVRAGPSQEGPQ